MQRFLSGREPNVKVLCDVLKSKEQSSLHCFGQKAALKEGILHRKVSKRGNKESTGSLFYEKNEDEKATEMLSIGISDSFQTTFRFQQLHTDVKKQVLNSVHLPVRIICYVSNFMLSFLQFNINTKWSMQRQFEVIWTFEAASADRVQEHRLIQKTSNYGLQLHPSINTKREKVREEKKESEQVSAGSLHRGRKMPMAFP